MKRVLLVFSLIPVIAFGGREIVNGIEWQYEVRNGGAVIKTDDQFGWYPAIPKDTTGELVIPSVLGGCPVVEIGSYAIGARTGITSVVIPSTVTNIGESAFSGCGIRSLTIPSSVKVLGFRAFQRCYWIASLVIEDGVEFIDAQAFDECHALSTVSIPSSVKTIEGAFMDCTNLETVVLAEGVTNISYAFADCTKLRSINFPATLVGIGESAFRGCALREVVIPENMSAISPYAFSGCDALESVSVLSGKVDMEHIFSSCSNIKNVTLARTDTPIRDAFDLSYNLITNIVIAEGVEVLPSGFLDGCDGLVSISIPSTLTNVESVLTVFYNTSAVFKYNTSDAFKRIDVAEENPVYHSKEGVLYDKNMTKLLFCPRGSSNVLEIPATVTTVGAWSCAWCKFKSLALPSFVSVIEEEAFYGCDNLETLTIPANVQRVGAASFSQCRSLTSATFDGLPPEGLENAGLRGDVFIKFDDKYGKEWGNVIAKCGFTNFEACSPRTITFDSNGGSSNVTIVYEWLSEIGETPIPSKPGATFMGWYTGKDSGERIGARMTVSDDAIYYAHWQEGGAGGGEPVSRVSVTVTNIVINYVLNSVNPEFVIPAGSDVGFVNIITEVKGKVIDVPATWMVNYPNFVSRFGADFTKALAMQTGKKDGAGNPMFVWQDYVAGTDPTDETDVFTASITIVDGKVKVSYSPELDDARKALRKYTIWGKEKLTDKEWSAIGEGEEGNFNFFKVTVEMR